MSSKNPSWFVYLLRCSDQTLYTGITIDLKRRLHEHNHTGKGAKYTRARRPVTLIYSEQQESRSAAARREYQLKALSREEKERLVKKNSDYH
ncbi:MAG: GIY-YIG nuclease family protein [Thermodesulfobacteriota bacterium]